MRTILLTNKEGVINGERKERDYYLVLGRSEKKKMVSLSMDIEWRGGIEWKI